MSLARGVVKAAAGAADRLRPPGRGVVVLAYHRVGGRTPVEVDLPTDRFAGQMEALHGSGRVVRLSAALEVLEQPPPGLPDPVVLTFDDGTADFVDDALPVLVRLELPVTLYLATAFVEEQRDFPNGGRPLSWAALRDAVATGLVDVGTHTHSHLLLDRAPAGAADEELRRSIGLVQDRLGVGADHFAYPKALAPSPEVDAVVRRRVRSAALGGTRPNRYQDTDAHRLARSPIQRSDGRRWFEAKVAGGLHLEDDLRRRLDRRRHRDATT